MATHPLPDARLSAAALVLFAVFATGGEGQAADAPPARPFVQPQPPTRPLLYYFEHFSLRRAAFLYEREIQMLIAHPRQPGDPVARLFGNAVVYAAGVPTFDPKTAPDDMRLFVRQIGFESIRRDGYTVHLVRMPPPEYASEAYFAAIAYKDGELLVEGELAPSTRYITLEKTSVDGRVYAVAEWDRNDRHKTVAFGDREPTPEDALENVFALLGARPI
jgi:hypothetical protein